MDQERVRTLAQDGAQAVVRLAVSLDNIAVLSEAARNLRVLGDTEYGAGGGGTTEIIDPALPIMLRLTREIIAAAEGLREQAERVTAMLGASEA